MTSASPLNRVLEKVKDLIPTPPQKEKEEKEEPLAKPAEKKEKGSASCPHYFGYLARRPKRGSIPEECLTCPQMLECKNASILRTR